jgi:hypothetical protein
VNAADNITTHIGRVALYRGGILGTSIHANLLDFLLFQLAEMHIVYRAIGSKTGSKTALLGSFSRNVLRKLKSGNDLAIR